MDVFFVGFLCGVYASMLFAVLLVILSD